MRLPILLAALGALAACTPSAQVSKSSPEVGVGFGAPTRVVAMAGGGASTPGRDFMDLAMSLESGRELQVFTRFEGPITVGLAGAVPGSAERDLTALVGRLRDEAGLQISVASGSAATITVEFATRADLRRLAPQAACFVVPNVGSLAEYRRLRGSDTVDWALITRRDRAAIFIPADTSPQEIRDCLHEELAQALGPLNDLYRLSDSIFNDDNFHSVLTAYDMSILRAHYDPALRNGMTRAEVAARMSVIFGGGAGLGTPRSPALDSWTQAIETALGGKGALATRQRAAERALDIARAQGWQDSRAAFSHFAVGRLNAGSAPETAFDAFTRASAIYARLPGGEIQVAHIDMQLAAMALAGGLSTDAIRLADRAIPVVRQHENFALLATLMLIKAEAMERLGDVQGAKALRLDTAAYARYGFGPDSVVRDRMRDIAAVASRAASG